MKDISEFKASWTKMSEAIHDMKGALTLLHSSRYQQRQASEKIGEALEIIDKCINGMVENEVNKDE